jgi:hypothetical protein
MTMNPRRVAHEKKVHRLDDQYHENKAATLCCRVTYKITPLSVLGSAPAEPGEATH